MNQRFRGRAAFLSSVKNYILLLLCRDRKDVSPDFIFFIDDPSFSRKIKFHPSSFVQIVLETGFLLRESLFAKINTFSNFSLGIILYNKTDIYIFLFPT